jgi:hypothetical protein
MKGRNLVYACLAIAAAAGIAGCGGGDGGTSATSADETTTVSVPATTSSTVAGQASPDDVFQACLGALKGNVPDSAAQNACSQVRDAFQQCATAAANAPEGSARDTAMKACQQAADQATSKLNSSG